MTTTTHCESCGMPIETGPYCQYCVGADGRLQDFDERLARMLQFQRRQHPNQSEAETLQQTLEYMATMPAWKDHPRVTNRARRSA
jgi:hypothetical protein